MDLIFVLGIKFVEHSENFSQLDVLNAVVDPCFHLIDLEHMKIKILKVIRTYILFLLLFVELKLNVLFGLA